MSIECIWRMKELTLTVPQVPWFLKTVKFFSVVASIPGRKSSGMSSERSWNFKSPFGSSLAVISRKALDGLIIVPSSPVSIPATKLMSAQEQLHTSFTHQLILRNNCEESPHVRGTERLRNGTYQCCLKAPSRMKTSSLLISLNCLGSNDITHLGSLNRFFFASKVCWWSSGNFTCCIYKANFEWLVLLSYSILPWSQS